MTQFFPRIEVETCAQMQTRVKLLEGMQMKTILKLFGGIYLPIPPGFRHPRTRQCTVLSPPWAKSLTKFNPKMQDFKDVLDLQ